MKKEIFFDTISERVSLHKELEELVGYLGYDINPIEVGSGSFDTMKECALSGIAEIRAKLVEIEISLNKSDD